MRKQKPHIICNCKKNLSQYRDIGRVFGYLEDQVPSEFATMVEVENDGICDNYNSLPQEARR